MTLRLALTVVIFTACSCNFLHRKSATDHQAGFDAAEASCTAAAEQHLDQGGRIAYELVQNASTAEVYWSEERIRSFSRFLGKGQMVRCCPANGKGLCLTADELDDFEQCLCVAAWHVPGGQKSTSDFLKRE